MIRRLILLVAVLMIAAFAIPACKGKDTAKPAALSADKVVATVGGVKITKPVLDWYIQERMAEHSAQGINVVPEALRSSVLEGVIIMKLLAMGAVEAGITVNEAELKHHMETFKSRQGADAFNKKITDAGLTDAEYLDILKDRLLATQFEGSLVPVNSISENDIKEYYKNNTTPFIAPPSFLVSFIEIKDEARANGIAAEVKAKGYKAVTEGLKNAKDAMVSGYGWASPEMFGSPKVAEGLKRTQKGSVSGPYAGNGAYYIFAVKDMKPERPMTIEEATPQISSILLEQRREASVAHWVAAKKRTVEIKIN